ncbi:serine protease [Caballeronia sp. GAWG1-5s-s]|uniref:S1 family peptidase n=1 Tax=unclassified Caballeronia TaxID=2646786 RepID=UPI0032ECF4E9
MQAHILDVYSSPNGDTWRLRIGADELRVVQHVPNAASGGQASEMSVEAFLSSDEATPQREALVALLDQLRRDADQPSTQASNERAVPRKSAADPLLLTAARVRTFADEAHLTNASGFFFARDGRLFLVTSRHVMTDAPSEHFPDRLEIELHIDADNLGASTWFSLPLYADGVALWREGADDGGAIDVAVLELARDRLPATARFDAFGPEHLPEPDGALPVGASVLIVGFPLGFHDSLHHLPVVRQGVIASAFGLRFQGKGCFITDARTHRGTSGAPVVTRDASKVGSTDESRLPWLLLGIHSSTIDMGSRDVQSDETLGLNSAWYSDILMTLTR